MLTESWKFPPGGIAMFEEKFGDQAHAEITDRTQRALEGIPKPSPRSIGSPGPSPTRDMRALAMTRPLEDAHPQARTTHHQPQMGGPALHQLLAGDRH